MTFEVVAYETPYIQNPTRTKVIGTFEDAQKVAASLSRTNYEVYISGGDSACYINSNRMD